jgi:proline dehydrogenase
MRWVEGLRRRRASAYGAGAGLDDALDACRRFAAHGLDATLGYSALPGEAPRAVADIHLAAFDRLSGEDLDCMVAVKLSALGFDPGLFDELTAAAAASKRVLHVDALAPDTVDVTWPLLERAATAGHLGATMPGRWHRSLDDASRAARLGLHVRVVKGQWPDDVPDGGVDPSVGFTRVVERLSGSAGSVAVATHDVALLAGSLRRLIATGTPCSAEFLFGLPFGRAMVAARGLGVPIRAYVPYGHRGATYGIKDLARRPAATRWLLEDLLLGGDKTWRSMSRS